MCQRRVCFLHFSSKHRLETQRPNPYGPLQRGCNTLKEMKDLFTCFLMSRGISRIHLLTSNLFDWDGDCEEPCCSSSSFNLISLAVSSCIFRISKSWRSSVSFKSKWRISSANSFNQRLSSPFFLLSQDSDAAGSGCKTPCNDKADHGSYFIVCFWDCLDTVISKWSAIANKCSIVHRWNLSRVDWVIHSSSLNYIINKEHTFKWNKQS